VRVPALGVIASGVVSGVCCRCVCEGVCGCEIWLYVCARVKSKRADLYGYNPKKDAELGADDNVLGNVPFLMAYGNKTTNKENAPYHGTFPAHFTSY